MRLFELKNALPKTVGGFPLAFDESLRRPEKGPTEICLPFQPEHEFFVLKNGGHFLFRMRRDGTERIFFGGVDEVPFVTELEPRVFNFFASGGEEFFYVNLRPDVVNRVTAELGVTALRQGDIFAVPLGQSVDEVMRNHIIYHGTHLVPSQGVEQGVLGTRHRVKGWLMEKVHCFNDKHVLAEGIMTAPDHKPLLLEGVHLLAQTAYLRNSLAAD